MNQKIANVLVRLSMVSMVVVSGAALAACRRAPAASTQAASEEVQAAPEAQRGPGQHIFREIQGLDLRDAQRDALDEIEQNLRADMAPHRETGRQVAKGLADALEAGEVDAQVIAQHQAALRAAADDIHAALGAAFNEVHDSLDAAQRADLVARLQAKHEARMQHHAEEGEEHHGHGMARLAAKIGLTEEQQRALREALQQNADELFPDRKARRLEWEARVKDLAESFVRDDFDAADHDLGGHAEEAIAKLGAVTQRVVDTSGKILGVSQRKILADMIRERAQKI
jgi:hypothetical protein